MASTDSTARPSKQGLSALVLRNALVLVVAQVAVIPLSMIVNAVMAGRLGPDDFGNFYLISTYAGTAFLFVEWGQTGTLPAMIAKQRDRAAVFLGSAIAFRLGLAPLVFAVVGGCLWLLGYAENFELLLAAYFLTSAVASAISACQDAVRGFERTDYVAYSTVGSQFAMAGLVIPVLLLGGGLAQVVLATGVAYLLVLAFMWRAVRAVGMKRLAIDRAVLKQLAIDGTPFFFFALTMRLQPNIDALYLSRLAPEHVVGWHAAAIKLIGVMVFPATALVQALYPTMSRLFGTDDDGYRRTARTALENSVLAVLPVGVGCYLYADLGIEVFQIFGKALFTEAADNLRLLAPFLFLVYISMPLGACILAAGKQRAWTLVQAVCIVVSVVLDPVLIPWFQKNYGNGGLGVCTAMGAAELLMVSAGVIMMPKGVFDRKLLIELVRMALAGGAMFAAGRLLQNQISPFLAAPLVCVIYLATLRAIGGLKAEQLQLFKDIVSRKARKTSAPPPG